MPSPSDEAPKQQGAQDHDSADQTVELGDSVLTELLQAGLSSRDTIGPYTLLCCLGEGGMGIVYEAEQSSPIRRRVAVKLVKEGVRNKEVLARFESERQALAVMDHPGIATVFDGGVTDTGRPYFAMELVRGDPIVEYCDRHDSTVEQRLRLFIDVCRAVQHAHQKGVIHRDLKPSNVLVQEVDGRPQPKIIDFGIAKAVGPRLTDATLMTYRHQLLGTPAFMSPEQLDPSGLHIDTRTDVYSLGVLLYVLLTGELPFGGVDAQTSLEELKHRVLSDEPMLPSRRLDTKEGVASAKRREPTISGSQLRGDLDWIVLKALEKDRSRRYQTVSELAADIERHLAHKPVSAGPPDLGYRVGKFVRRHRVGVSVASAFALLLATSIVLVSLALVRARQSEEEARTRAAEAEEVTEFLVDVFDASDPYVSRGQEATVQEVLERGTERIDDQLGDHPAARAKVLATLGRVMMNQGLHEKADELLVEAEREAERLPGRDDLLAYTNVARAFALTQLGRPEEAFEAALRGVEWSRQGFGEASPELLGALRTLGFAQLQQGGWTEAIGTFREALEIDARLGEPEPLQTAELERLLGFSLHRVGDPEAESHVRRAYELYRAVDPAHPHLAWVLSELGSFASNDGRLDEAVSFYERALELQERTLGEGHLATADVLNDLGVAYWYGGRREEAERYWLEALEVRERHLSADNPALIGSLNNLALIAEDRQRLQDAEAYYRRALEIGQAAYGVDAPQTAGVLANLALVLQRQRRFVEAEPLARRSLALQRETVGESAAQTLNSRLAVAQIERALGEVEQAAETLRRLWRDIEDLSSVPAMLKVDAGMTLAHTLTLLPVLPGEEVEAVLAELSRAAELPGLVAERAQVLLARIAGIRAVVKAREGDAELGDRLFREHLERHEGLGPTAWDEYQHGRVLALLGRPAQAGAQLERAEELGFAAVPPERDPALAALHGDSAYESLVSAYRQPWPGTTEAVLD